MFIHNRQLRVTWRVSSMHCPVMSKNSSIGSLNANGLWFPEWNRHAPTGNFDHRLVGFIHSKACGLRRSTSAESRLSSMIAIPRAGVLWLSQSTNPVSTYRKEACIGCAWAQHTAGALESLRSLTKSRRQWQSYWSSSEFRSDPVQEAPRVCKANRSIQEIQSRT
jgi:hypothetical protein